jgi:hypothetical protein
MYPSTVNATEKDWVDLFDERPDVMHSILGDIYAITKANQAVTRKPGRRPRHVNGNLDELYAMITPTYATVPFGEAVAELIGTQSIRQFSAKIPMHYWSLIRLMRGERQIVNPYDIEASMKTLEMIAKAGKVQPSYFVEYRTLYIMAVFRDVFAAKPNVSIGLMKRLRDLESA